MKSRRSLQVMVHHIFLFIILEFNAFVGPVINEAAFEKITRYIDIAKKDATILTGGGCDKSVGYFIHPTIILAPDPAFITLREEVFGPVLTCFVYPDSEWEEQLKRARETSQYALTAAFFATDTFAIEKGIKLMRHAAGNLYINDKCTAAVVGAQPFGGARRSGTNDKAGSMLNLLRWTSPRTIKENHLPLEDWRYPSNF